MPESLEWAVSFTRIVKLADGSAGARRKALKGIGITSDSLTHCNNAYQEFKL